MVKSLRRNFITVLLVVCVIFSLILPIAAVDPVPTEYNRAYLGETSFGKSVTDVLTDYSVAYDTVADLYKTGFSQAYQYLIDLFGTGGTNKAGVAQAAVAPVTDDRGYVWYPLSFSSRFSTYNDPSLVGYFEVSGNRISEHIQWTNGLSSQVAFTFTQLVGSYSFTAPVSGQYAFYAYGDSSLYTDFDFNGNISNLISGRGFSSWSPSFSVLSGSNAALTGTFYAKSLSSNTVYTRSLNVRVYAVFLSGSQVAPFSGFGGGQTRGGGAGRKYNLIPAAKADSVAVGSGVSRADVLADYALFDEGTKAVSIPQADGSTVNYTANTWVYNYETRTYNITTTNNTTVYISYGDDKTTVTDGTNSPVDYYYAAPVSAGGDSGGDSGGSLWDKLLGGLADGILAFFKAVGVVAASILTGLVDLLTSAVESIGSLVALVGSLGAVVGGFFAFLPVEVQAAVSAGLIVVITFSVISVLRK